METDISVVFLRSLHFSRYTKLLFQGNDAFTYYNVRYDRIWYRYCFERFSWYANMILIYTYIHTCITSCQNSMSICTAFSILRNIYQAYTYMRKRNSHLHSLLLLLNISFVYIRQSAYFWTMS